MEAHNRLMALKFFSNFPLNGGTELDQLDFGTGNGIQTTFAMTHKLGSRTGNTVQADNVEYFRYTGGVVISANNVILSSAPSNGSQIVFPGMSALVLSAFDTDNVPAVTTPRVKEAAFYLMDEDTIATYQYDPMPGSPGVQLTLVNNITSIGPDLTWFQLACSDANGNALTYAATGVSLYIPEISYVTTLMASSAALATSMSVIAVAASGRFYTGDYIQINSGYITQEDTHITAINGNTLTISGFNFPHYAGELVFTIGRKCWTKMTVPEGATGGTAHNYFNIGVQKTARKSQRL